MRAASSWLPEISQMWARSFLSRLAADCLRAKVYSEPSVGLGVSLCMAARNQDDSKVQACGQERLAVAATCSQAGCLMVQAYMRKHSIGCQA